MYSHSNILSTASGEIHTVHESQLSVINFNCIFLYVKIVLACLREKKNSIDVQGLNIINNTNNYYNSCNFLLKCDTLLLQPQKKHT